MRKSVLLSLFALLPILASGAPAQAGFAPATDSTSLVVSPSGPYTSIEAALKDASDGDTISVQGGEYHEHLLVDKSVTLTGVDWPLIEGDEQETVVILAAPGIVFSGFDVRGSGIEPDRNHAGIHIIAPHIRVENNRLSDVLAGIFVEQADHAIVRGNQITSKSDRDIARKGDAIRLWYSKNVLIEGNHIYDARDIVMWYGENLIVRGNVIERGRYGIHMMYCNGSIIEDNQILDNSVGIFTMYTTQGTLRNNLIRGQRGPSGYALGFKDADNIEVAHNLLINNRVAIFLDGTPYSLKGYSRFVNNVIAFNDVGVALQPSVKRNEFLGNTFWENVEQSSIHGGGGDASQNTWQGNYWSDYSGFDANGDGVGDLPYHSDRFFEGLIDQEPRLAMLLYSPAAQAVEFAATTFPIMRPQPKLSDPAPSMSPANLADFPLAAPTEHGSLWPAALLIIGLGLAGGALGFIGGNAKGHQSNEGGKMMGNSLQSGSETPLITAAQVSKKYGKVLALEGVDFDLRPGEALALWGANGAGKSTLLKAVLGLITFEGSILVAGLDPRRRGKQSRSLIGYVPQESVFYDWSVRDTLSFYARLKKIGPARVAQLIDQLGLSDHINKPVPALSGGLKQRLALAVALLSDPPVLVLDEPTASLDARARRDYLALLASLRAQGKAILFASHRFEEVEALADRALVLESGRLIDTLSPRELRGRYLAGYEMILWIPEKQHEAALKHIKKAGMNAHRNGSGTIIVQVEVDQKMKLLDLLNAQKISINDFHLEQHETWN
jgi:nitrous oxidase accessory protein